MNGLRSDRAMELLTWLLGALIALGLFGIIVLTFGTCGAPRAPSRRAKSISTPSKAIVRRSGADRWESILPGLDALPKRRCRAELSSVDLRGFASARGSVVRVHTKPRLGGQEGRNAFFSARFMM